MSKNKKYQLPSMEYPFSIAVQGEETKMNWAGKFLFRRPTLRERTSIAALKARLNLDLITIDEDASALNEALAFLRFTLKDFPEWWKETDFGGDLYDPNVVIEIYNKCMAFEAEWRIKTLGPNPEKIEAGNEAQDTGLPSSP